MGVFFSAARHGGHFIHFLVLLSFVWMVSGLVVVGYAQERRIVLVVMFFLHVQIVEYFASHIVVLKLHMPNYTLVLAVVENSLSLQSHHQQLKPKKFGLFDELYVIGGFFLNVHLHLVQALLQPFIRIGEVVNIDDWGLGYFHFVDLIFEPDFLLHVHQQVLPTHLIVGDGATEEGFETGWLNFDVLLQQDHQMLALLAEVLTWRGIPLLLCSFKYMLKSLRRCTNCCLNSAVGICIMGRYFNFPYFYTYYTIQIPYSPSLALSHSHHAYHFLLSFLLYFTIGLLNLSGALY